MKQTDEILLYREPFVPTVHLFGNVERESLCKFHILAPSGAVLTSFLLQTLCEP